MRRSDHHMENGTDDVTRVGGGPDGVGGAGGGRRAVGNGGAVDRSCGRAQTRRRLTIEILGTGCSRCRRLEKNVRRAVDEFVRAGAGPRGAGAGGTGSKSTGPDGIRPHGTGPRFIGPVGIGPDRIEIVKVEDIAEIADRGVMMTPALAIDGRVVVSGRIPGVREIVGMLRPVFGDSLSD